MHKLYLAEMLVFKYFTFYQW